MVNPRKLSEISAEIEAAKETFIEPSMLDDLVTFPSAEMFPVLEAEPGVDGDPKTSFKAQHDPVKIDYLMRMGVSVPDEWYTEIAVGEEKPAGEIHPSERIRANPDFHAEIVTAMIILQRLRDIFYLREVNPDISDEQLRIEMQFHSSLILESRVDLRGYREPDVTGKFKNREARLKNQGLPANPTGTLSIGELEEIRDRILDAYKP